MRSGENFGREADNSHDSCPGQGLDVPLIDLHFTTSGCGAALCDARVPQENSAVVITVWACSSVSVHPNSVHSYSRGLRLLHCTWVECLLGLALWSS